MPATSPDASTLATAGFALLHVPPGMASLNKVELPWQMFEAPEIAAVGLTVMI
jgi:hypothetical protein